MLNKLKITVKLGIPYYFVDPTAPRTAPLKWVKLTSFKIVDGRLEWNMVTSDNHRLTGTLRSNERLPYWPDSWVTPSIPVVLHDKQQHGLAPDFIFNVPTQYSIDHKGR